MLDNGFEVDLSGLSDSYVMQKLNKVLKLMRLKRSPTNRLEFKKKEKLHDFKMKAMIQHFIDEIQSVQKKNESDDEDSDEYDSSSESDSSPKNRKKSRKGK